MTVRIRRTAEESRELILTTAARRLRQHGLEGLNITGVSEDAGISHATLIHHFGSSGGMRDALADHMTAELIRDMLAALNEKVPTEQLIANLFAALNEGGHAKLLAWRAVAGKRKNRDLDEVSQLFEDLLKTSVANAGSADEGEVKKLIFLVSTAAIGGAIAGSVLPQLLGLNEQDMVDFPAWMTHRLSQRPSRKED